MSNFIKDGTIILSSSPSIHSFAAAVGKMEGEGPLGDCFDFINNDVSMGEETWEKAESRFQQYAFEFAINKGKLQKQDINFLFAGDLQNQCAGSAYSVRDMGSPFVGLYGACSTMAESLSMASIFIDNGIGNYAAALTSSHFCSAERQFRFPVNYGGQRTPTAQWTATASGCAIVSAHEKPPYVKSLTIGKIMDMKVTDANNMGAAMAGAAYETISTHMENTGKTIDDYDMIYTGDLGQVGSDILHDLFARDNVNLVPKHKDCGLMLYDLEKQDVHAGGSGCGCSASVLCGHILKEIQQGHLKNVLFTATGALMSPTVIQQGESILGIAHSVHISNC